MTYFEHLNVGERCLVRTYRVSKEDAIEFASQWEPQPYHVDAVAAEDSLYVGLTVSSLHLFAICTRLFLQREDRVAVMAMLGKDKIRFPKAARPGENLTYYTQCVAISLRRPRSSPARAGHLVELPEISSVATSLGARSVCVRAFEWSTRHPIVHSSSWERCLSSVRRQGEADHQSTRRLRG